MSEHTSRRRSSERLGVLRGTLRPGRQRTEKRWRRQNRWPPDGVSKGRWPALRVNTGARASELRSERGTWGAYVPKPPSDYGRSCSVFESRRQATVDCENTIGAKVARKHACWFADVRWCCDTWQGRGKFLRCTAASVPKRSVKVGVGRGGYQRARAKEKGRPKRNDKRSDGLLLVH